MGWKSPVGPCHVTPQAAYCVALLQSQQGSISSENGLCSLIQCGHMDIITYILSPLPYSVGVKLFVGPAHTWGWGGIMQEWECQDHGSHIGSPSKQSDQNVESLRNHGVWTTVEALEMLNLRKRK